MAFASSCAQSRPVSIETVKCSDIDTLCTRQQQLKQQQFTLHTDERVWDLHRCKGTRFRTTPCRLKIPLEQPPLRQTSPILGRPLRSCSHGRPGWSLTCGASPSSSCLRSCRPQWWGTCRCGPWPGLRARRVHEWAPSCGSQLARPRAPWYTLAGPRLARGYPCAVTAVPCLVLRGVYRGLTLAQPQSPRTG